MLEMTSTLLSYFFKIAHMSVVERMYLSGFVCLIKGPYFSVGAASRHF